MNIHAGSLVLGVSCMKLNPAHFLIFSVRLLHSSQHFCNGPCGNWAQGLPHAERVWYHYTNHHQPTMVPDLVPLFGILLCPFRHAFGPQTELWCHGISFSSCIYSFRASPHKCPYTLNPAHFPFAHHFCASPTQSFAPCKIFSSLLPLTILEWTMWGLNPGPPAC